VFFETAASLSVRLFVRSAHYGRSKDYVFWCLFTIAKLASYGKGLMLPVCFCCCNRVVAKKNSVGGGFSGGWASYDDGRGTLAFFLRIVSV